VKRILDIHGFSQMVDVQDWKKWGRPLLGPLAGVLDFDLVEARQVRGNLKCEATVSFRPIWGKPKENPLVDSILPLLSGRLMYNVFP
jgi:hypothetical protein